MKGGAGQTACRHCVTKWTFLLNIARVIDSYEPRSCQNPHKSRAHETETLSQSIKTYNDLYRLEEASYVSEPAEVCQNRHNIITRLPDTGSENWSQILARAFERKLSLIFGQWYFAIKVLELQ